MYDSISKFKINPIMKKRALSLWSYQLFFNYYNPTCSSKRAFTIYKKRNS